MKKILATIFVISLILTGCMSTEKESKQTESSAQVLNLGMTFEQFKTAYNAKIAENFSVTGWDISETKLKSGEYTDTFMYKFNENVALLGSAEKNSGMMIEVMVAEISHKQADVEKAMAAFVNLMLTLSPELTVEQRGQLLKDLKLAGDDIDEVLNQNDGVAVRGNVKYVTTFDKDKGVLYFIATAKDLEYWNQKK